MTLRANPDWPTSHAGFGVEAGVWQGSGHWNKENVCRKRKAFSLYYHSDPKGKHEILVFQKVVRQEDWNLPYTCYIPSTFRDTV